MVITTHPPDGANPARGAKKDRQPGATPTVRLPPGQRLIEGFPRFGEHLSHPAPPVPVNPVIEIRGAVAEAFAVPLAVLATLPRREITADFHCVAGWTATNLRWEGVPFETFYRRIIEPTVPPDTVVTHLMFRGLDGFRSVATLEDALADGVLIAEHLNGRPLDSDHGAPARLVSPNQYGYVSTKHLSRIEVHTAAPNSYGSLISRVFFNVHPRARVWEEERHGLLPAWFVRPIYRSLIAPLRYLCARGSGTSRTRPARQRMARHKEAM
jgi:DMSO/TMAO reductase YedYZ molybdopterin-dependent catalytic subunit